MIECVLSVDIGTTSLKASFVTGSGEVAAYCAIPFSAPENRFVAEAWIWSFKGAVDKLKEQKPDVQIKAISVSGNGPTLVSENGLTLRWNEAPGCQINLDDDAGDEVKRFEHSIFLPRILLFKDIFADEFSETKKIFSGPEYLIWQLTANDVTILPEKRFETAYWNAEVLEGFGISSHMLPDFVDLGTNCGTLTDNNCEFLGLDKIPVFGVGPDFIAGLIGCGTVEKNTLCDRCGSSEGINFCTDKEIRAEGIRTLPCVKEGLWNLSVLISESAELAYEQRIEKVIAAIELLRKTAMENKVDFPSVMTVTGGQAKDEKYFKIKKERLEEIGIKIEVKNCLDAELLGDAIVAWEKLK